MFCAQKRERLREQEEQIKSNYKISFDFGFGGQSRMVDGKRK